MMEDLSPKLVSLLLLDLLDEEGVVFLDELVLHDPDILLDEFGADRLMAHFSDVGLEVLAEALISVPLLKAFSFKDLENLLKSINVLKPKL